MTATATRNLLPLVDAARVLRRDYQSLWKEVVSGTLPAERIGSRWYVSAADVRELATEAGAR